MYFLNHTLCQIETKDVEDAIVGEYQNCNNIVRCITMMYEHIKENIYS